MIFTLIVNNEVLSAAGSLKYQSTKAQSSPQVVAPPVVAEREGLRPQPLQLVVLQQRKMKTEIKGHPKVPACYHYSAGAQFVAQHQVTSR